MSTLPRISWGVDPLLGSSDPAEDLPLRSPPEVVPSRCLAEWLGPRYRFKDKPVANEAVVTLTITERPSADDIRRLIRDELSTFIRAILAGVDEWAEHEVYTDVGTTAVNVQRAVRAVADAYGVKEWLI